jgi:hypothetical protein
MRAARWYIGAFCFWGAISNSNDRRRNFDFGMAFSGSLDLAGF